jgi:ABC-type glutathione transport system ATPase component
MILDKSEPSKSAVVLLQDLVLTFKKRKEKSVFQRQYTAVDHLSFYVPQGSCFGLLGTYCYPFTMDSYLDFFFCR